MRLGRILTATALLLPATTGAQQPQTFSETTHVELVLVDVLVTGRDGKPVLDLAREDFMLYVDGSPQQIDQFSAPTATPPKDKGNSGPSGEVDQSDLSTGPAGNSDHLLVIYLEDHNLMPSGRHRILAQLNTVLDEHSGSGTRVMIAAYDGAVNVLLEPTQNRKRISKVLAEKTFYGAQSLLYGRQNEQILTNLKLALESDVAELDRLLVPQDQIMDLACSSTHNYVRGHVQQVYGALAPESWYTSTLVFG